MDVLRNCYDPEIPVNIVDLGLVYGVAIDNDTVKVRMTLTAMGCPASAYLSHQVKELIEKIPGVRHADVDIVWDKSDGSKTIDELTAELSVEKKVSPTEIRMQILEVITQLVAIRLIAPEGAMVLPLHP